MNRILFLVSSLLFSLPLFAEEMTDKSGHALAAGLAIAIAAGMCAIAQGIVGKAFIEGNARNPSAGGEMFTRTIVILALIESLAIYAFVIALMIKP